ncbi:hypothetical protein GW17_00010834 [Ensete ventricosum]|nr:hypothetical protein GW17_00010834 [Ensete ventricosum]
MEECCLLNKYVRFAISTCTARYGWYISVRHVTGTWPARYWVVPAKINRWRSISAVGGRLKKKSTIGNRLREKSTVGGRLRKKKGRRGKEEKKKRRRKNTSPARRCRPRVARGRFFSRARRRSVSPRGEKDRGDIVTPCNPRLLVANVKNILVIDAFTEYPTT